MSFTEVKLKMAAIMPCDDNTCCCIPKRSTVVTISIINFVGCFLDLLTSQHDCTCELRLLVASIKKLILTLFQMANVLLLLASIFEKALLVDIYVWCTLGYIVMGFGVAIYEFVVKTKCDGCVKSLIGFVPEVIFLFVIFRCLPLVDIYRRHLYNVGKIAMISHHN